MEPTLIVLASATALVVVWFVAEYVLHRLRLRRIPVRIHVNGTRGKSSVVRLITAGLRAGGVRCVAKTTGTLPRFILPSGREVPVHRAAGANIIEQKRAVAVAAAQGAEALVVECMALQPQLQWLSERKLVRSTHGVITNARPDHLDVMGPTATDVARALAATLPVRGRAFTAEEEHRAILEMAARDRKTALVCVSSGDSAVTQAELERFPYREHGDNVALALAVCEQLGVTRETALEGMWGARPDPGAMTEHYVRFFGRELVFVNGFAANDPVSTRQIWEMSLERHRDVDKRIAVFNCRADRADRSQQLAQAYAQWPRADEVVLIGSAQYVFAKAAARRGIDPTAIHFVSTQHAADIFEQLVSLVEGTALIMGLGNIAGPGIALTDYFANRSEHQGDAPSWI